MVCKYDVKYTTDYCFLCDTSHAISIAIVLLVMYLNKKTKVIQFEQFSTEQYIFIVIVKSNTFLTFPLFTCVFSYTTASSR